MRVSVAKVKYRTGFRRMVSWTPPGSKRQRRYFKTKTEAEKEAETIRSQHAQLGRVWLSLTADQRNELIALFGEAEQRGYTLREAFDFYRANHELAQLDTNELLTLVREAKRGGFTLRQAVDFYRANPEVARSTMTVGESYALWLAELERQGVKGKSLRAYRSNVGRFLESRKPLPLTSITREGVIKWLNQWTGSTFNTYLTSLKTFFKWCQDTKKVKESPTSTIKKIKKERLPGFDKPPTILSLLQTARLLKTTLDLEPGLIPYVAAGLFGGLRPEKEAACLLASDLHPDGTLHVRGSHAKDRQQRYVNMTHTLKRGKAGLQINTLKAWMQLGGDFGQLVEKENGKPRVERPKNFRRRWERVREAAGLIQRVKLKGKERKQIVFTGWDQDCLRHTFASHFLPLFGADETIRQLGHGDYGMLFGHYRALVKEKEARRYWTLTPDYIRRGKFNDLTNPADKQ